MKTNDSAGSGTLGLATRRLDSLVDMATAARKKGFGEERAVLLSPYLPKVAGIGMRIQQERPPRFGEVEGLMYAVLLERELAEKGLAPKLELLRKVQIGAKKLRAYAVDGVRAKLPDFPEIRTVTVDGAGICVPLSYFLDLSKVGRYLKEAGFSVAETRDRQGRRMLEATSRKGGKFCVKATSVHFDHTVLERNEELFEEGLTRFVEFICLLPYVGSEWALGTSVARMHEIRPFLELVFNMPRGVLGGLFSDVASAAAESLSGKAEFAETNKSRILREKGKRDDDEKSYRLGRDYLVPHVDFIVVKENKDEPPVLLVGIDCYLDLAALGRALAEKEGRKMFLTTPEQKIARTTRYVNKGSCIEVRKVPVRCFRASVLDEEGKKVAQLHTPGMNTSGIIIIPLRAETKEAAAELLNIIYDGMLFYTPKIRSEELGDSRLTELERHVVVAIDSLVDFYNYFLKVDHEKEAFRIAGLTGTRPQDVTAHNWLLARLRECPAPRFEAKVLHALRAIRNEVDVGRFSQYGERSQELYDVLNNMIGRMEALCAMPVLQEGAPQPS